MTRQRRAIAETVLFRVGSKAWLCKLLGVTRQDLKVLCSGSLYNVWPRREGGRLRWIEEPTGELRRVHNRLLSLLAQIDVPTWLFSGVRGRSYVGNAQQHVGRRYVLSCDIHHFYQQTQREYVFRFFHQALEQPEDIAWALTDLTTLDGHLPTGSPCSQLLAFWAYRPMFEEIHELAAEAGASFSLYVDDMTLSSSAPLDRGLVTSIRGCLRNYSLRLKESKTRIRGPRKWKVVTGVALSPEGAASVPNKLRHSVARTRAALLEGTLTPREAKSSVGRLNAARQIVPSFHEQLLRRVRGLEKRED